MSRIMQAKWILTVIFLAGLLTAQGASSADANLKGTVKSLDGKLLEGVAVAARADDRTFTTTVYTDQKGEYFFPPLETGHYKMWAQSVGYDAETAELQMAAAKGVQQNFSLKPLQDFSKQLSGSEWMASLPSETPADRRMKAIIRNKCADCHSANFVLLNRFDKDGWSKILNLMTRIDVWGEIHGESENRGGAAGAEQAEQENKVIGAYREELAEYLARVRGPNSVLQPKPYPRLTGQSLQIVVTEYDIPVGKGDEPEYMATRHTGAIWSEGAPSAYQGRGLHDVVVDRQGNVWCGDDGVGEGAARSLGKLDPRTGHVTGYRLRYANERPAWTNGGTGIRLDPKDDSIWFAAALRSANAAMTDFKASDGGGKKERRINFNPKTGTFEVFTPPDPIPGSFGAGADFDSQGRLYGWRTNGGLTRLDTKTGKWDEFKLSDRPYGIAVDANDNAWFTLFGSDQVGFIDHQTDMMSLISLPPLDIDFATPKDRAIALRFRDQAPIWAKGPRRMAADKGGDKVWFALYYASRIASVDINTKEVKEYSFPRPDYTPYRVEVDKNHMVWITCQNSDRIFKFNPVTEEFTEYPLPTLGTGPRHIHVDNSTDPPTVWLPYFRVSRVARVQFRTTN